MIKKTSQIGSKAIRSRAKKVLKIKSLKTRQILKDLVDSMRKNELVGMAAPQIGESVRIFITEVRKTHYRKKIKPDPLRIFINPRMIQKSKKQSTGYEGCGSVASAMLFGPVRRPEEITIQAQNIDGNLFELKADGLLARVIQHEMDHLDGVVFIDRVSDTRTLLGREEYLRLMRKK